MNPNKKKETQNLKSQENSKHQIQIWYLLGFGVFFELE